MTNNEVTPLCPSCVIDYIEKNSVSELGDEVKELHDKSDDVIFTLCETHQDRNIFQDILSARTKTLAEFRKNYTN